MRIVGAGGAAAPALSFAAALAPRVPLRSAPVAPVAGWTSVGHVRDPRLTEISGVVASRTHPGTLWVHNDSGDGPRVFALGPDGTVRGEVQIDGAQAADWEDIAIGPGPAGSSSDWLYVADTGNNFRLRRTVAIYRFPEPGSTGDGRATAQKLDVRFDDGDRHNVEAMFVDPRSGDMLLVTKTSDARAQLFRISARAFDAASAVAEQVGIVEAGSKVTGADISPDGARIAIRTSGSISLWDRRAGESITDAVARTPVSVAAPSSESIAFSPDGASWISISEGANASVDTRRVPAPA